MEKEELLHANVTDLIIKSFYHVYNTLGFGFLEKVYENALALSLRKLGLEINQQTPIKVYFEGQLVGEYFADLVVGGCVIIELKAAESLIEAHETQLINYLRATEVEVGLLLNFGAKPTFRRKVFSNVRKFHSLAQASADSARSNPR